MTQLRMGFSLIPTYPGRLHSALPIICPRETPRFGGDARLFQPRSLDVTYAVDVGEGVRQRDARRCGCSDLIAQLIDAFLALLGC